MLSPPPTPTPPRCSGAAATRLPSARWALSCPDWRTGTDRTTRPRPRPGATTAPSCSGWAVTPRRNGGYAPSCGRWRRRWGRTTSPPSPRNDLAAVLHAMERYADAVPVLRAVLDGRVALHGDEHPATVATRGNLANVLIDVGRAHRGGRTARPLRARIPPYVRPRTPPVCGTPRRSRPGCAKDRPSVDHPEGISSRGGGCCRPEGRRTGRAAVARTTAPPAPYDLPRPRVGPGQSEQGPPGPGSCPGRVARRRRGPPRGIPCPRARCRRNTARPEFSSRRGTTAGRHPLPGVVGRSAPAQRGGPGPPGAPAVPSGALPVCPAARPGPPGAGPLQVGGPVTPRPYPLPGPPSHSHPIRRPPRTLRPPPPYHRPAPDGPPRRPAVDPPGR